MTVRGGSGDGPAPLGSAPTLRLHHVPMTRSFRILWLAEELGLTYTTIRYRIGDRSMREGGLDALSPATRVPAIEYRGEVMAESGAIVMWLSEHPDWAGRGFGRPPGNPERARYLEWIGFAETMASLVEQLNLCHIFLRPPAAPPALVIKLNTARLRQTVAGMEARLGDGYLLPGGVSAADMMMGFNLLAVPHFVDLGPFPKVAAYRARIMARPAFERAMAADADAPFYDRPFYEVPST